MHELATLITEIKIMALKIEGSALMPAISIAITKISAIYHVVIYVLKFSNIIARPKPLYVI